MKFLNYKKLDKLVILDCSFNPPTLAHYEMSKYCNLMLISTRNADKGTMSQEELDKRLKMMLTFDRMIGITDSALFLDKARELRQEFKIPMSFLMGMDTLVRFFDPKYYQNLDQTMDEFFQLADIHYFPRKSLARDAEDPILELPPASIRYKQFLTEMPPLDMDHVSSSRCRQLLKDYRQSHPESLKDLMPPQVLQLILENSWYS